MAVSATLGLMVLYRTGKNRYSPAVIQKVNENYTVDLTVFGPAGDVSPARNVKEGDNPGQWCHTGIDAREAAMAAAAQKPHGTAPESSKVVSAPHEGSEEDLRFRSTLGADRQTVDLSKKS